MKKLNFAFVALMLVCSAFAQEAAVQYFMVNFSSGSVVFDASKFALAGNDGTNYLAEGDYYYFRAEADPSKAVRVNPKLKTVEIGLTAQNEVNAEIGRLARIGVLANISSAQYDATSNAAGSMMAISAESAQVKNSCCEMSRKIAPISASSQEDALTSLNAHALPPMPLSESTAVAINSAAMPSPEAGEVPEIAAAKFAAPEPEEKAPLIPQEFVDFVAGVLPILVGVAVLAYAGIYLYSQRPSRESTLMHEAPEVVDALSNETRVEILQDLAQADRIPTDISTRIGKSKATVSEHLEQLMAAGLVEKVQTPGKKFVYYRLSGKGRSVLLRWKIAG